MTDHRPKAKIGPGGVRKAERHAGYRLGDCLGRRLHTSTVERWRKVQRFSDVTEPARAKGRVSGRRNLLCLAGKVTSRHRFPGLVGYRDVGANELSGPGGRPIPIDSRHLSNLSDEELGLEFASDLP